MKEEVVEFKLSTCWQSYPAYNFRTGDYFFQSNKRKASAKCNLISPLNNSNINLFYALDFNLRDDTNRDCCAKCANGLNIKISHSSKSIWVIKLFFCHNNSPMGQTFWQKDRFITHILFELSPVANFGQQSL